MKYKIFLVFVRKIYFMNKNLVVSNLTCHRRAHARHAQARRAHAWRAHARRAHARHAHARRAHAQHAHARRAHGNGPFVTWTKVEKTKMVAELQFASLIIILKNFIAFLKSCF